MSDTTENTGPRPSFLLGGTPASIKSLRRFYKKSDVLDAAKIFSELYGESDRSAVILMAAILDHSLISLLEKHLCFKPNESDSDYIFRFEGPLGTFSARMEVACLLGFIDDDTYQQLDIVRELRNACAHSMHPTVFSDPVVANVVKRLFRPLGFFSDSPSDHPKGLKKGFILEGMFIIACLNNNSRIAAAEWINNLLIDVGVKPLPDKTDLTTDEAPPRDNS
jgi:hypothetical protein